MPEICQTGNGYMRRRFARQPFLLSQQQPASSKHKVKPTRAFLSAVAKLSFKMPKTRKVTTRVYGGAALVAATFKVPAPPAGASAHVRTAVADYNKLANAIEVNKKSEDGKLREALREATKSPGIAALGATYVPYKADQSCGSVLTALRDVVGQLAAAKPTAAKVKDLNAALTSLLAIAEADDAAADEAKKAAEEAARTAAEQDARKSSLAASLEIIVEAFTMAGMDVKEVCAQAGCPSIATQPGLLAALLALSKATVEARLKDAMGHLKREMAKKTAAVGAGASGDHKGDAQFRKAIAGSCASAAAMGIKPPTSGTYDHALRDAICEAALSVKEACTPADPELEPDATELVLHNLGYLSLNGVVGEKSYPDGTGMVTLLCDLRAITPSQSATAALVAELLLLDDMDAMGDLEGTLVQQLALERIGAFGAAGGSPFSSPADFAAHLSSAQFPDTLGGLGDAMDKLNREIRVREGAARTAAGMPSTAGTKGASSLLGEAILDHVANAVRTSAARSPGVVPAFTPHPRATSTVVTSVSIAYLLMKLMSCLAGGLAIFRVTASMRTQLATNSFLPTPHSSLMDAISATTATTAGGGSKGGRGGAAGGAGRGGGSGVGGGGGAGKGGAGHVASDSGARAERQLANLRQELQGLKRRLPPEGNEGGSKRGRGGARRGGARQGTRDPPWRGLWRRHG